MGLLDRPGQSQRFGLLSPDVMGLIRSASSGEFARQMAPAPAAPPRRERVSGLRVFDRVLGGQTISEGLDAERARLEQEAMRPQMEAERRRLQQMAEGFGPEAVLALALAPDETGKAFASNLEGYTLGGGGLRGGARGVVASAPTFSTVNDQIFRNDPATGESAPIARADPSFADQTGRINAMNVNVAANADLVNPTTGQPIYQGFRAPEVSSVPQGGSLAVTDPETGEVINTVQGNPANGARNGQYDATTRGALQEARNFTNSANRRIALAREFIDLNTRNPTGLGAAGPLGLGARLNPSYDRMDSISASLIPKEREPGSGPMSDKDIVLYGRAQIGIGRPGPANQAIANAAIAQAERDIEYSEFLDAYAEMNGNIVGSTEDWQAYVNANPLLEEGPNGLIRRRPTSQITPWREFMGFGERQRGGGRSRAGGGQQAAPSGGAPVTVQTPAQAQALRPGTRYRTPDGREYVR